jgi:hypothetical protein
MFSSGTNTQVPRYTQLQVQTSAQGLPVPLCWGAVRGAFNLIWNGNFNSEPVSGKGGGGKGGAKGGQQYTYSTAFIGGLCEGALTDMNTLFPDLYPNANTFIGRVWRDQAQMTTLSKLNVIPFQGEAGQSTWPYLASNFPSEAIPYSALAYVASSKYDLGYSPSLPDHSFELFGKYCGSYTQPMEQFTPTGNIQVAVQGGAVYSSSDSFFDGIEFTYQGPTTNPSANVYLFTPPGPAGTRGSGTLTLVSGSGPTAIPYSAAENVSAPVLDANPADVIEDFLTNPQYAIGLTSGAIDSVSLEFYRTYCAAQGLFISPLLSDQEQMSQTIDRWASITNTLIFWSEGMLKFVPLGDSAITNTGIAPNVSFTPNLSVAYGLTYDDYIDKGHHGRSGEAAPPLQVTRIDPADAPNHVKVEVKDRANAYNTAPIEWQDQALVDQFGQINSNVTDAHEICSISTGNIVAQLIGQRLAYQRNTYAFTLGAEFSLLEPGDIVTVTEPHIGIFNQPVRIKTIDEDDKYNLAITAEEFPGTLGTAIAPDIVGAQQSGGGTGGYDQYVDPGNANPPCVFEPNSALTGGVAQVWISLSGGASWGGSIVLVSFDGTNYNQIGFITAPAPQGATTADLPSFSGANPDTTHTLAVDLTESGAVLPTNATDADAQAYRTLCYVTSSFTVSDDAATLPDTGELLAYGNVAQGATAEQFNISYLERGLYGTEAPDHPEGSFFTRVELGQTDPPGNCVLIYDLPTQYIGTTIYLKFLGYNTFGNELQDPSDVVAYAYTTTGAGFGGGGAGVPIEPTGLTATGIPGGIALSWNANPPTDNVLYYDVYRDGLLIFEGNVTNWTDTSVVPGASHTYAVEAVNIAGDSVPSASATAAASASVNGGRSVTVSASPLPILTSDNYVGVTNTSGAALAIDLPSTPATNQDVRLADEGGNAATFNWTVRNTGGAIVGTVAVDGGGISLHWTGAVWQQVF